jgi:hypothetical protein
MERILLKFTVLFISSVLIGLLPPAAGMCAGEDKTDPADIKKMEETIKKQEEQIKQLQSDLKKLRDRGSTPSGQQQPPDKAMLVEAALRESWGSSGTDSRVVTVNEGTVSIQFNNIYDLIAFFDSGAEKHARSDLAVFLTQTGLERGSIEYYSARKKLYSISGSLTEAKPVQHY